jgi:hypothetical protein
MEEIKHMMMQMTEQLERIAGVLERAEEKTNKPDKWIKVKGVPKEFLTDASRDPRA